MNSEEASYMRTELHFDAPLLTCERKINLPIKAENCLPTTDKVKGNHALRWYNHRMAETKILKPAGSSKVRRPDFKHLNPEGERVQMTSYWVRRLAAGEVVEVSETAAKPAPKTGGNK